ncbi:MAG: hypothetical protein ACR2RF_24785 [Geminicoccaceae bacterium]
MIDPELQKYMQQQRMQQYLGSLAQGFMQAAMGGRGTGAGVLQALASANAGGGGPLDALKMQMQLEQLTASRDEREKDRRQSFAAGALAAGPRYDPDTEILWNQPPQPGREPRKTASDEARALLAQADPGLFLKSKAGEMFPGPMKASDLIEVDTPEGPRLVPAAQAVGKTPYDRPESLQLKEIYDPDSPTGTRLVREAEAVGRPGKPASSLMQITGYDEAGRPLIRVGGRGVGQIQKKTAGDLEAKLLDTTDALVRIENTISTMRPEFLTLEKRAGIAWDAFREKIGIGDVSPQERSEIEDYTIWQSTALDNINRGIHNMTGAQMAVAEADRIRGSMPDPGEGVWPKQSPTEFVGQIKRAHRDMRAAQARYAYALRNGLTTDPEALSKQIPLDRMEEIIQARAEEIEASLGNVPPDEVPGIVAARLAREFGLPF